MDLYLLDLISVCKKSGRDNFTFKYGFIKLKSILE